jgi:hypothetical protein
MYPDSHRPSVPTKTAASRGRGRHALAVAIVALLPAVSRGEALRDSKDMPLQTGWLPSLWMTQEYRFRSAGSAETLATSPLGSSGTGPVRDQDLRLTLDGSVVGLSEHFVGTLSAALWLDLDGQNAQDKQDVFGESRGIAQSLAVIYTASAEWRRTGPLARLALGRQQANHGLPVSFDGGSIDLQFLERRLSLFAFGGQTVHFFETRPGLFENWLVSAGVGLRLGQHVKVEADSRYLRELVLGTTGTYDDRVHTNSYGATMMGRWDELQAKLFARGINHSFSHVGGSFQLQAPLAGVGVFGQVAAQLVTLGEIAESENPYYSMLGNCLPHLRGRLEAWKDFDLGAEGSLVVALGTRLRQLLHDQPTRFNRNTNAMYLRVDLNDKPFKGALASVSADWNMPTQPDDSTRFFTVGGSAGYKSRSAQAEAGTYYQRFKINYYRNVEEMEDVRTVYAMGAYRVLPQLEIRGRYVIEVVDRTIHSVYLTLREDL